MNSETSRFNEEVAALRHRLLSMAQLVEERLRIALHALVARDRDALSNVVSGDARINELQIEVDRRCFTLIALQQPVAGDLRTIVSVLKINADLERVGELAVNIGRAAQRYLAHPPVKPLIDLPRMGELALTMLREALNAFIAKDVTLAHGVLRKDDWLDALNDQIVRELLTHMLGRPEKIEPGIDLMFVARHLERVGDHATNIAEDVIFIVDGRDVRHRSTPIAVERRKAFDATPMQ